MKSLAKRWFIVMLAVLVSLPAAAQSCALCYSAAAASKQSFIQGLRHGILVLMVPPMAICLAIGFVAYRRRQSEDDDDPWAGDE
jgi:hypothetical protein